MNPKSLQDFVPSEHRIVFYDGLCNFCNATVNNMHRLDKSGDFYFASLQSDLAQQLLPQHQIDPTQLETFVFYDKGKAYKKSSAAIRASKYLKGIWPILRAAGIFPAFFRDFFYDLVAKNRYRILGKKEQCSLPSAKLRARFLDELV